MKKSFKKTLSLVLAFVMTISGLGVSVLASEVTGTSNMSLDGDNLEQQTPNIINEIISKRTSHSKVFSTDDGGYYTIVSSTPIHILDENGEYQNIEEPTSDLRTEETISAYVSDAAELYNETATVSTYSSSATEDAYVNNSSASIMCFGESGIDNSGYYVQGSRKGNKIVCIKPEITSGNILVTSAKMNANALGVGTTANNYILVKQITSSWNENNTSKPSTMNSYFDCIAVPKASVTTAVSCDVTYLMNAWQLGLETNYGFALTTKKANCSVSLSDITLSYYYREISDIDNSFTYETIDMGSAGTVYINHYSCIPSLQFDDVGIDGEKAPVFLSHSWNLLNTSTNSTYGYKYKLNYSSTLQYSGTNCYIWNTIGGKSVNFTYSYEDETSKIFVGSDGNNSYVLSLAKDSTTNTFSYTDYENIIIMNEDSNEKYTFESHSNVGYLKTINDGSTNQNTITISYDFIDEDTELVYKSNNIQSITDGVGREYIFNYDSNDSISYLSSIDVLSADGTPITVGNTEDSENYSISYDYSIINNVAHLTSVNHVGESSNVVYTYDDSNRLTSVSNGIKLLTLTYDENLPNQVKSYCIESLYNGQKYILDEVTIDNSLVYQRTFTNYDNEVRTINFDENYNTVYYQDYDGTVILGTNPIYLLPEACTENIVLNRDFEEVDDSEYPLYWEVTNEDASIMLEEQINDSSLRLDGSLSDTCGVYQQIDAPDGISFKSGSSYIYGGLAKANNALTTNSNSTFGIYVFNAVDDNGTLIPNQCISHFNFDSTLYGQEQQKMSLFTLEQDSPALFIYICFDYNCDNESAYFDDIQLFEYINNDDALKEYENTYNDNNSIQEQNWYGFSDSRTFYLATLWEYDNSCSLNYVSQINDERGITTYYKYDAENGRLISMANNSSDLNGTAAKSFEYTASGLLSSVKQTVTNTLTGNVVDMETEYGYSNDRLTSVTHNGFSYNFSYDAYGNVTNINVSSQDTPLVTTTYFNARKHQTDTITYANGDVVDYTYDTTYTDRITQIDYKDSTGTIIKSLKYTYDDSGKLNTVLDENAKIKLVYSDNSYTYITLDNGTEKVLYNSAINDEGNTVETFTQANNYSTTVTSTPTNITKNDSDDIIRSSNQTLNRVGTNDSNDDTVEFSYDKTSKTDKFNRLIYNEVNSTFEIGSEEFVVNSTDSYSYNSNNNRETTLVNSYRTVKSLGAKDDSGALLLDENNDVVESVSIDFTFTYTYDDAGNIEEINITDGLTNTTTLYAAFRYDNSNQLIGEYYSAKNCCILYSYDAGGNIIEKKIYSSSAYDYENDTFDANAEHETLTFTYSENYKDLLTSFDGQTIQYDSLGNPLNYTPASGTLEWSGRLLTAFETTGEGNRYEYEYDGNGLRTRKIIYSKELVSGSTNEYTYEQSITIEYVWDNNKLVGLSLTNCEDSVSFFMNIIYDESGIAQGYVGLSGTPYYFVRDGLGNVTSIISANENIAVNVSYDAWGNPTFPSGTDDLGLTLATTFICYFNPSTYKGYLFDYETGLYYCHSRYYSSVWSRFINMDDATVLNLTQDETLGSNLYTYCNNDPVNNFDPNGYLAQNYYCTTTNIDFDTSSTPLYIRYALDISKLKKTTF